MSQLQEGLGESLGSESPQHLGEAVYDKSYSSSQVGRRGDLTISSPPKSWNADPGGSNSLRV